MALFRDESNEEIKLKGLILLPMVLVVAWMAVHGALSLFGMAGYVLGPIAILTASMGVYWYLTAKRVEWRADP